MAICAICLTGGGKDPTGLATVDPSDPQSWNRYAYVTNDPLSSIDPLGLRKPCTDDDDCPRLSLRRQLMMDRESLEILTTVVCRWGCSLRTSMAAASAH